MTGIPVVVSIDHQVIGKLHGCLELLKQYSSMFQGHPRYFHIKLTGIDRQTFLSIWRLIHGRITRTPSDPALKILGIDPGKIPYHQAKDYDLIRSQFMSVFGIGRERAHQLWNEGFRTLHELKDADLTSVQIAGLKWHRVIATKIDREVIERFARELKCLGELTYEITGSFRRGLPRSSDIDLLVRKHPEHGMRWVVNKLSSLIVEQLVMGPKKFMGIVQVGGTQCRLDIRVVDPAEWWYFILHNTGPKTFNIRLIRIAANMGLQLTPYGMTDQLNKKTYPATSEAEIFTHLRLRDIPPAERDRPRFISL